MKVRIDKQQRKQQYIKQILSLDKALYQDDKQGIARLDYMDLREQYASKLWSYPNGKLRSELAVKKHLCELYGININNWI